ncbi:hypothetical protein FA13DRAFT_1180852 [Coprinellus micaceus]|uniref:Uncharacterized protein n=1 Tax=Coprinellus micaceus TaxID=71717 RepID=A0A4Y7RBT0_COPMI|nr:hypothetical protein FA13DRAFT_1180852 [Coprinellus micaceus]
MCDSLFQESRRYLAVLRLGSKCRTESSHDYSSSSRGRKQRCQASLTECSSREWPFMCGALGHGRQRRGAFLPAPDFFGFSVYA